MSVKKEFRKELIAKRKELTNKEKADVMIRDDLVCSDMYLMADKVLFYAALDDEINIDECIEDALFLGKTVALPVCINSEGLMDFYIINSMSDLKAGSFGVREPDINKCAKLENYDNSICIVPGLSFNKKGERIGYGKGYYDRFLSKYSNKSIGLCYNQLMSDEIPTDEYDMTVDYVITENGIFECKED